MRFQLFIIMALFTTTVSYGQKVKTHQNSREVVISTGDSIIVANILLDQSRIKPDIRYTYYWYLRGKICHNRGGFSGKLLDGRYQVFVQDRLILSGNYKDGKRTGEWITWDNYGNIKSVSSYKNVKSKAHSKDESEKKRRVSIFNKNNDHKPFIRLFRKRNENSTNNQVKP